MGIRSRASALPVVVAIGVLFACGNSSTDDNQFREDVFQCEEAVARLATCCPGLTTDDVPCVYFDFHGDDGCGNYHASHQDTTLSINDSKCIRDTSCEDLVAHGVCKRAISAGTPPTLDGGVQTERGQVCQ